MILENPALELNIRIKDIIELLEKMLHQKNWKHFEVASFKLIYTPYYVFNYDTLVEQKIEDQTFSKGFSGLMAINAVNAKLEPLLSEIMEEQPVSYEKEITHDLDFELEPPALTMAELPETCRIKLAGQFNVGKESMAVSGFRLIHWPIWRVFVSLPEKTQRIDIDGVSGYPLNIEEVPTREKGWFEVTADTLAKMKTPGGWADLSKQVAKVTATGFKGAAKKGEGEKTARASNWLLRTKTGIYTLLFIIILIIILLMI